MSQTNIVRADNSGANDSGAVDFTAQGLKPESIGGRKSCTAVKSAMLFFCLSILLLAGCDHGPEVESSFPGNGDTVSSVSSMEVLFSSSMDPETTQDSNNIIVTRSSTGEAVEVTLTLEDGADLSINEPVVDATDPSILPVVEDPNENKTNRRLQITAAGAGGFGFLAGEKVTILLKSSMKSSSGVSLNKEVISFFVGADFSPSDTQFVVSSTSPAANSDSNSLRPNIAATFNADALVSSFEGNVLVTGSRTGRRQNAEILLTASEFADDELTARKLAISLLSTADSFLVGEEVTLSFLRDIREADPVAAVPDDPTDPARTPDDTDPTAATSARTLRAHSFNFTIRNGRLTGAMGGVQSQLSSSNISHVIAIEALDILLNAPGNELLVLDRFEGLCIVDPGNPNLNISYDFGQTPKALKVADLDGDGKVDYFVATESSIFQLALKSGSFEVTEEFLLDGNPAINDIAIVDFTGDGNLDIVVATQTGLELITQKVVPVLDTTMPGLISYTRSFSSTQILTSAEACFQVAAGDMDEDGLIDLVTFNQSGGSIYRGAGEGVFLREVELEGAPADQQKFQLVDFEGDGDLDIVSPGVGGLQVFLNGGTGTEAATLSRGVWVATQIALDRGMPVASLILDYNGSSRPDVVALYDQHIEILRRNSQNPNALVFAQDLQISTLSAEAGLLSAGDMNQDGGLDLLIGAISAQGVPAVFTSATTSVDPVGEGDFVFDLQVVSDEITQPDFDPDTLDELDLFEVANNGIEVFFKVRAGQRLSAMQLVMQHNSQLQVDSLTPMGDWQAELINESSGQSIIELTHATGEIPAADDDFLSVRFTVVSGQLGAESIEFSLEDTTDFQNTVTTSEGLTSLAAVSDSASSVLLTSSVSGVDSLVCEPSLTAQTNTVQLSWVNGEAYDNILIETLNSSGSVIGSQTLPQVTAGSSSNTVRSAQAGENEFRITGYLNSVPSAAMSCTVYIVLAPLDFACERSQSNPEQITLTWRMPSSADHVSYRILRDGEELPSVSVSDPETFSPIAFLNNQGIGGHLYELIAQQLVNGELLDSVAVSCEVASQATGIQLPAVLNVSASFNQITLDWSNQENYSAIRIYRGLSGQSLVQVAEATGAASSYSESVDPGSYDYEVEFEITGGETGRLGPVGVTASVPPPADLVCSVTGVGEVELSWSNPLAYQEIRVSLLDGTGATISDEVVIGTTHSFSGLSADVYTAKVEGELNGEMASTACNFALTNSVRLPNLMSTAGAQQLEIPVRAFVLNTLSNFSVELEYDTRVIDFGSNPELRLASGQFIPQSDIEITAVSENISSLRILNTSALVESGVDQLLVTLTAVVPADAPAISSPLTLVSAVIGGGTSPELEHGSIQLAPLAVVMESRTVMPGEQFEVLVYATYDVELAAYTIGMDYDPAVVSFVDASVFGTIAEDVNLLIGPSQAQVTENDVRITVFPQIDFSGLVSFAPGAYQPVLSMIFEVHASGAGVVAGSDTGIALNSDSAFSDLSGSSTLSPSLLNSGIILELPESTTIFNVQPATGSIYGGQSALISGALLNGNSVEVQFGAASAQVTSIDEDELQIVVPPFQALGPILEENLVTVSVSHSSGSAQAVDSFTYLAPLVSGLDTSFGIEGQQINIVGSNFPTLQADLAQVAVRFDGQTAQVLTASSTANAIAVLVPAGSGQASVEIDLPLMGTLSAGLFDYMGAVAITSVSPAVGSKLGGSAITITGSALDNNNLQVLIGGEVATIVSHSGTEVQVTLPAIAVTSGADQVVDVQLTHDAGSATASKAFTYQALRVDSLTPNSGGQNGGAVVTVLGAGFALQGLSLNFAGMDISSEFISNDGTSLQFTTPAVAAPGQAALMLSLTNGESVSVNEAFLYLDVFLETMDAQTPTCGGLELRFIGASAAIESVDFGGVSTTDFTLVGSELTVVAPAHAAGVVDIALVTASGSIQFPGAITYGFSRGDVNNDGSVNVLDLSILSNFIIGSGPAPAIRDSADVNDDGSLHVGDVVVLSQFLSGEITSLPAPFGMLGEDTTLDFLFPACP